MKRYNTRFCSRACRTTSADPEYFWRRVEIRGPDKCWPWKTGRRVRDYGGLLFEGKIRQAHQVAFRLAHGFYAPYLRHTCDFPPCCNPAHLVEGTHAENMADAVERGRRPRGEASSLAKLTEADVRNIRADPRRHIEIAADYGVHPSQISRIKEWEIWKHL